MNAASPEQEIFAAALACATPVERAACLDARCGDDAALRRRVEVLLAAADAAGDFLEEPPSALAADGITEKPGDRIGRYKLLEKIGEGGCGVVYMAEQEEPVRRRVALKVIKPGMDTRAVIARFEAERQALAMMDHANIARVFDGGATAAGRPFFVMELVRGTPITAYCDEVRLATGERLRLFLLVCQAVQHAHQKGIIHRDLKPSNILVTVNDGVPVPKVIDFGIAKATGARLTDKSLFTQFHAFIGTPAYTSPEQAEMTSVDVDTRSDIYSLGVLLYELLTSRTPFDSEELLRSGLDEMRRIIRTAEPPRPSNRLVQLDATEATDLSAKRRASVQELTGAVRGDLDWIVMKCLEKDRTRRYDTASNLAADVRHHLDHEPIAARPPTRLYRLSRLVWRNRGVFAALAAIILVLCAGIAVSVSQALRAHRGEAAATAALTELRDSFPLHAAEAQKLAMEGEHARALTKLDYALRLAPQNIGYLLARADLLECQLRFPEAVAAYRSVLALDPANAQAQRRMALSTQLAQGARDPQWHDTLSDLYVEMTSGRTRSWAELSPVANPVWNHAKDKIRARDSAVAQVLVGGLVMDWNALLALDIKGTGITDLSPLRGLPLKRLVAEGCPVTDLEPLRNMRLSTLDVNFSKVADLEPVRGMTALQSLSLVGTNITDLGPLQGLPELNWANLSGSPVTDLTPLRGSPLRVLRIGGTKVADLSPLAGLPLSELICIGIPAADFSPLAACPKLQHLDISGTAVPDLEAFRNGQLVSLTAARTRVRDLSPLAGTPLSYADFSGTLITDITPLLSCSRLLTLILPAGAENVEALRALPNLQRLSFRAGNNGLPSQSAAEFWKEHPAGK